jgi:hypothetical protein
MPRVARQDYAIDISSGGWWSTTTHAFDGVRSPQSPRSVGSFGTGRRFPPQRRAADSRESARSARSLGSSSVGMPEFCESEVFGADGRDGVAASPSLRLDGKMEHRFSVDLPIEKRQGDGGLSHSINRWLDRGSGLPRDFRHIRPRPSSPVAASKRPLDLEEYAIGDHVTPRPGVKSFEYGGFAAARVEPGSMVGVVRVGGNDVMVDFAMPPTEWDPEPRPTRLWLRASELRLVKVAAEAQAEAEAAAAAAAAEEAAAAELAALHAKLAAASEAVAPPLPLAAVGATDEEEEKEKEEEEEEEEGQLQPEPYH